MSEVKIPSYTFSRTRTRTYDVENDPRFIMSAILDLICPPGTIIATLSNDEPGEGWKLLNGQTLTKDGYPRLYAIIGGTWGETTDTFDLPDLSNRMLIGSGDVAALAFAGSASLTLTEAQLPAHSHALTDTGHSHGFTGSPHSHTVTDPGHSHSAATATATSALTGADVGSAAAGSTGSATTGISIDSATAGGTVGSATTGITMAATGDGDPIDTTPPVLGIYWMVRT